MAKETVVWAGVLCVLLTAGGAASRRISKRELRQPALALAAEQLHTGNQPFPALAADILQPRRLDSWRIIGPGGGGTSYYPAISPYDSNLVFVSTDMTGCYGSETGGRTWRTFNLAWPGYGRSESGGRHRRTASNEISGREMRPPPPRVIGGISAVPEPDRYAAVYHHPHL